MVVDLEPVQHAAKFTRKSMFRFLHIFIFILVHVITILHQSCAIVIHFMRYVAICASCGKAKPDGMSTWGGGLRFQIYSFDGLLFESPVCVRGLL